MGKENKIIAISQSNYIPWKGYFELIDRVDEFIFYDQMQYTRRDWRNRNRIKTTIGLSWLTLPVEVKGKYLQKINQTQIADLNWSDNHWRKITNAYRNAPFFKSLAPMVYEWYRETAVLTSLSQVNQLLITRICQFLNIDSKLSNCSDYSLIDGKSERLLQLCLDASGDCYMSGPAAKEYLDLSLFQQADIKVLWMDYTDYPEYPQLFGDFQHNVSILDVIFNCGPASRDYVIRGRHDA